MSRAREGQFPPPGELAELIYYWMQAWPKADLSEKKVAELYPYIVQKWREGMNLRHIAQTACSCDDGRNASSAESVGELGFWESAEGVVEGNFKGVELAETVGVSEYHFGFVVEALDDA